LLILDEFGFDKLERAESPQAANLLYKVIDARHRQRSTALVTNIDFEAWGDYLADPPLAMAFLDRVVDGALLMKIPTEAKSHRANRARRIEVPAAAEASSEPSPTAGAPAGKSTPAESSSKSAAPRTSGQRSVPKST
jgi:hypothetical protein